MKASTPIEKHRGRYLPWAAGSAAFLGLAGTLWALSEALENDTDGDGIADYLEFIEGTDPLDPNDPPRIRKSVLTYSVAAASDVTENISLESLKSGSQQNMYHNTAWFGKRLNYTFFRPTADSKWKAINGNEIEYWSTGYYDLLARNEQRKAKDPNARLIPVPAYRNIVEYCRLKPNEAKTFLVLGDKRHPMVTEEEWKQIEPLLKGDKPTINNAKTEPSDFTPPQAIPKEEKPSLHAWYFAFGALAAFPAGLFLWQKIRSRRKKD